MKHKLFQHILRHLSKVSGKRILYTNLPNPSSPVTAAKSKYGFWYCGDVFNTSDLAHGVAVNGEVEAPDTHIMRALFSMLDKEYVLYDIGANTGWYSCLAAHDNNSKTIYAFEPLTEYLKYLKESAAINNTTHKIHPIEIALSDKAARVTISLAGTGSSLETDFLRAEFDTREISTETLDHLVKNNNLETPHIIKIDVEGHEYKTLLGARNTLTNHAPLLYVEIAKTFSHKGFVHHDFSNIFTYLASLGYQAYIQINAKLVAFFPESTPTPDDVQMYLFVHKNSSILSKHEFVKLVSRKTLTNE